VIIDFHTHVFPDKIAEKTVKLLEAKGGIPSFSDGTADGLTCALEDAGVDIAVTLPVLTNPKSFDSVNRYAAEINARFENESRRLISFGAIHPACENIEGKMKEIKSLGFRGVKIHPDYQETYINDDGYVKIVNAARELDLIVITHAGVDFAYPDDVHCTPPLALELLKKAPHEKFVFAHLGGEKMQEEFLDTFADTGVYFDTAYVLRYISPEIFNAWLARVGNERILFASDSPWSDVGRDVEILNSFVKDEKTRERLFSLNAKKLLGI
jgi:predicted TIM-barrel fold metal-dependent hydrolase